MTFSNFNKLFSLLLKMLPYIHKTIWFNFHYFPLNQAKKLPVIFLSKSHLALGGKCIIDVPAVKFGMIKFGHDYKTNRPDTGFFFSNKGGTLVFKGHCTIGRSCSLEIGEKGYLEIGENVQATYGALFYAFHNIIFGDRIRIGWNSIFMDTAFHSLKLLNGGKTKGYGSIIIGSNVWVASNCQIMAKANIPDYSVIGAHSVVNKDLTDQPAYSLFAGSPIQLKKTGLYRDVNDDIIIYE